MIILILPSASAALNLARIALTKNSLSTSSILGAGLDADGFLSASNPAPKIDDVDREF